MRVLRLDLEYDGAGFSGWAAQPGRRTVEGELRRALGVLLGEPPDLAVAGRTDAGVHASGQVVSVATGSSMAPERLLRGLGGLLPADLSARAVSEAPRGFDARRDAVGRRYEYRVLTGAPSALRRGRVLHHPGPLDLAALRAAAAHAVGRHDFRAFTPTRTEHVFFDRTLTECDWTRPRRRGGARRRGRRLPAPHGADPGRDDAAGGPRLVAGRAVRPAPGGGPEGGGRSHRAGSPPDARGGPVPARPGVTRGGAAGAIATLGGR